ncbi:MAG: MoaD/ThiS family protein [Planctomycetota bacterium]|jgi:molybdopterin converting factor small subunit
MSVVVRLHAGVRERAGVAELTVEGKDIGAVRAAVAVVCPPLAAQLPYCRFAMEDEFVGDETAVREGAVVDVIPPVSGG